VTAELPGVDEKDLDVTLANGMLTVRGEKRTERDEQDKDKSWHVVERSDGLFSRAIPLPFDPDPAKVEAKFDKGVYEIRPGSRSLPRRSTGGPQNVAKVWNASDIYITENGCSATDVPAADGLVYDTDRIMFRRSYLTQLQRATSEGVPVRGYFHWSLMDNFEWARWVRHPFWAPLRRLCYPAAHAEAERIVLPGGRHAKPADVVRSPRKSSGTP
jgi:hypothetical protein